MMAPSNRLLWIQNKKDDIIFLKKLIDEARAARITKGMKIEIELTGGQALSLAQFIKRVGYFDAERLARSVQEAEDMLEALSEVEYGLSKAGYEPR